MKKILGLDLGVSSIGWALVNQAENDGEKSSIIKLGVRVNPLTVDELMNFEKGKSITTNAERTLKRSMRRSLQRYKLRRQNLVEILQEYGFISHDSILSENGNKTTFETYRLRAKAATEEITLEQFARILLMINKKRGYKSSRKSNQQDEGKLIDGMEIAKKLYDENLTPGQFVLSTIQEGKKHIPDFYLSDLQSEFNKIWSFQVNFYPDILTDEFRKIIIGEGKLNTAKIFLARFGIYTAENKGVDKILQAYKWRVAALSEKLSKQELAFVICDLNGQISNSSGYLGAISDRSKELYFSKLTVGQYLMKCLEKNPNFSLKNKVFYRQDYLDEFNTIWESQARFHRILTEDLKSEIRDVVIFYQRRLKSQKGLVSYCEFENRQINITKDGKTKKKTVGLKACPKSSPLFQEFKIWQILNNIQVIEKRSNSKRFLNQDEKEVLFSELSYKEKLTKEKALKMLYVNYRDLDLNYRTIEGNKTLATLMNILQQIIYLSGHGEYDFSEMKSAEILDIVISVFTAFGYNTEILKFNNRLNDSSFEKQALYKLWHLLYSYEGDKSNTGNDKLIEKLTELTGFNKEYASLLAGITFKPEYGSLSAKAIRKILPFLQEGHEYSLACEYAGYRHSKSSLTKDEKEKRLLKDKLNVLPKNSLRNPVVEKILNQMINVINAITDNYGRFDEIHVELARELKKSAGEREELIKAINRATAEHERFKSILQHEFGIKHVSHNDLIRYKLYLELESNGFHTLYSNTYISPIQLFSKEIDIEHIIPQSRLFDDSFSNKTLELRSINIEKGNDTAYDFIFNKYGTTGIDKYLQAIEGLFNAGKISKAKYNKLRMKGNEIPDGFIERDLRNTQYISRKATEILNEIVKDVIPTTGLITDKLREDWQLIDLMQELNWNKYNKLGLTEIIENRDGHKIRRIKDWSKRNDHRHHAMDALTIAFTKRTHIQYLNNLNARSDKSGSIYAIETKELVRDNTGKLRFKPPIPLNEFRSEAKKHLESLLTSVKAKNKVVTINTNKTAKKGGINLKKQLTPRGQLHLETIYGSSQRYITKTESIGSGFDEKKILTVSKAKYRIALLKRLKEFENDPKKAFTGATSLKKNPVWVDETHTETVPEKVDTVTMDVIYTVRKEISPDLKTEKVVDKKARLALEARLKEFDNDKNKAFSNLDENPIWLNKQKGISIKRVTITGISNTEALHDKMDKDGRIIHDKKGNIVPVDFVSTGNNHHVAIYQDEKGNLQDIVVSFFEATTRANAGLPIIDKEYKKDEGWLFLFSMKQNEYFVFPNNETGFDPKEIDLISPENYYQISPNLFRVQKFSKLTHGNSAARDYVFRHHLETSVKVNKALQDITYKRINSLAIINRIVKVRINHIGKIVSIGEY